VSDIADVTELAVVGGKYAGAVGLVGEDDPTVVELLVVITASSSESGGGVRICSTGAEYVVEEDVACGT